MDIDALSHKVYIYLYQRIYSRTSQIVHVYLFLLEYRHVKLYLHEFIYINTIQSCINARICLYILCIPNTFMH